MMRHALLLAAMLTSVLHALAGAQAQPQPVKVGYLTGGTLSTRTEWLNAFRQGMREFGYEEDRTFTLTALGADGQFERLPELAARLLQSGPDVLLASTTPGALAAKAATKRVPIVVVAVGDPLGAGLVTNLARPGGNLTGITNGTVELTGKRLQLIKDLMPAVTQVAVLADPGDPITLSQLREAEAAAASLGIVLGPLLQLRGKADLEPAFKVAARSGAQAALRLVDPLGTVLRADTARLALLHRLPMVHAFRPDAEAGAFASYGTRQADLYRRAASFVHRILSGTPPGDLPVEQPTRFELVINLKTARALGLSVPASMLARADEVIE
jgi:putative ABC transport system substrate-binding protein